MPNGVITSSNLPALELTLNQLGMDEAVMRSFAYDPIVTNALTENQTAVVTPIEDGSKDRTMKVHWMEVQKSATDPQACDTDCNWTGERAGTYVETYTPADCVEYNFSYSSYDYRTSQFDVDEEVAKHFLRGDREMTVQLEAKSVAFLEANHFDSTYAAPSWTNTPGMGLEIPASEWTPSIYADFNVLTARNYMSNSTVISGLALHKMYWEAQFKTDGESRRKLGQLSEPYIDLMNLDQILPGEMPTFLVNNGSYAIGRINRIGVGVFNNDGFDGRVSYSIPSQFANGFRYDVYERRECVAPGEYIVHVKMTQRVDFFLAPQSVDLAGNTGILKLKVG